MRKIDYLVQGRDTDGHWHDITMTHVTSLATAKEIVRRSMQAPQLYSACRIWKIESVIEQIEGD
jgi:hypothetical protein